MMCFLIECYLTSFVSFSHRGSSGSTIGITTLSFPSCSTGWVSRCPAGSEKNWSTPGSSTTGGRPHLYTLNHCSSLLGGGRWPSGLKCSGSQKSFERDWNVWRFEDGMPKQNLIFLNEQDDSGWWERRELSCFQQLIPSLSLSFKMPLLPCRSNQDHGSRNDGFCCVLKKEEEKKERLSDTQEWLPVVDNHIPALLNQTFSSSLHELLESQRNKRENKVWSLSSHLHCFSSGETGGSDEHNITCVSALNQAM